MISTVLPFPYSFQKREKKKSILTSFYSFVELGSSFHLLVAFNPPTITRKWIIIMYFIMANPFSSTTKRGCSKIYYLLLVFGPFGSKQLAKKSKLPSVSGRKLSYGTITRSCGGLRFSIFRILQTRGGWCRWQSEEKGVKHTDDLTEAWSHVWILNPAWLYDKGKVRRYIFWKARPLMLQSHAKHIIIINKSTSKLNLRVKGS